MLEMLAGGPRHPLRTLRESVGISQAAIAKATGLSTTKISMSENYLGNPFTAAEEKKIKEAIVEITKKRQRVVLSEVSK